MCQSLPYVDFRWVDDVENFNVMDVALDSSTGYILEVDLKYPQHFHDIHTNISFIILLDARETILQARKQTPHYVW